MKNRYYGIDILRIFAMYLVVILHICNQGGVESVSIDMQHFFITSFYKSISCIAVDLFALISGFVGYRKGNKKHKYARYFELWMEVVFWCLIISLIMHFAFPEKVGLGKIIKSFLPVTTEQYWYFSAYTALFLVIPLLNKLIESIDQVMMIKIIFIGGVAFSLYSTVAAIIGDPFGLKSGYSFIWLSIMYIIGGLINKFRVFEKIKYYRIIINLLMFSGINFVLMLLIKYISIVTVNDKLINYSEYLLSYISPTVVILSISFLALFAKVNIDIKGKRGIVLFSSAAFGVYLIHTNQLVWNYIFHDAFTFIGKMAPLKMFIAIPIIALLIFTAGLFLEIIRIYIVKFLKINLLCEKIEYIMRSMVHLIVRKYIQS